MLFIRWDVLEICKNMALPAYPGQHQALSSPEPAGWVSALVTGWDSPDQSCHSGKEGISTSCALTFPLEGEQKRQFTPVPISWVWGLPGSPVILAKLMSLVFQNDWIASVTVDSKCRCMWKPRTFRGLFQHPLPEPPPMCHHLPVH